MSENKTSRLGSKLSSFPSTFPHILFFISFTSLVSGAAVPEYSSSTSPSSEKQVLLDLKHFLLGGNRVNRGVYADWNESEPTPCRWAGIACGADGTVTGIDLHGEKISGRIFPNFSLLPVLSRLDLSANTIVGPVPPELNQCRGLRYLNLSHNLIDGELNLTALTLLDTLDVSFNRFVGDASSSLPANCGSLVTLNVSSNNFTGEIGNYVEGCRQSLGFLDLSLNRFAGQIWRDFWWLKEFLASDNHIFGEIKSETFPANCSLETLDLSSNALKGTFPNSIGNCSKLKVLNIWGNSFIGRIPSGIGLLSQLEKLFLGQNNFDKDLPTELLNCQKLEVLDLSRNNFDGEMQTLLRNFTSVKFLILHENSYTGGIEESGVLELPNLLHLDLSFNNFSRELPIAFDKLSELRFLILANNEFYGKIPPMYGRISNLQMLDLSFNRLTGGIPPEIGNLTSLLWLMVANNGLTGEIPPEIGYCSSLLWLNLANNYLSGRIPAEISRAGRDPSPTFEKNRRINVISPGAGECLAMKRWLPATYPPFNFVKDAMTRRTCQYLWDQLLKGQGIFPVCLNASSRIRTLDSTGYFQLSGNLLSGEVPPSLGLIGRLSMLNIDNNDLSGRLPSTIGRLPLVLLNLSKNHFSGLIPSELGDIQCLQILDLSWNNFSGQLPSSLNGLSDLNKFNASFNPLLQGTIPIAGQIATFDNSSFIGDPQITFATSPHVTVPNGVSSVRRSNARMISFWTLVSCSAVIFFFGIVSFVICLISRSPVDPVSASEPDQSFAEPESFILDAPKRWSYLAASPSPSALESVSHTSSSPGSGVTVFRIDNTAFTYTDIVAATGNFSVDMVIGRGGSAVVYSGVLPDGRQVAVKKLRRSGAEGERAFRAEVEVLACGHPNLVALYGWCLAGSEKLLVYEYMKGGSLDDAIKDRHGFGWSGRVGAAVAVARALVYLHHECVPAVVHRDVKASNVMMNGSGVAKLTDFGLARMVVNGESHVSTVVAGTVGYVAPEYGQMWRATTKGDVYSFGVLTMELATGRRAVEDLGDECLVEWARRVGLEAAEAAAAAAAAVDGWGEEGESAVKGLLRVGFRCTEEAPQARPDMREVLQKLLKLAEGVSGGDNREAWVSQAF